MGDEKFQKAFKLWLEYERDCEFFDRGVCTGGIGRDGGVMPAHGYEMVAINAHAKLKRQFLEMECSEIPPGTIQKAKEAMNQLSHQGVLEMLEQMKMSEDDRNNIGTRKDERMRCILQLLELSEEYPRHHRAYETLRHGAKHLMDMWNLQTATMSPVFRDAIEALDCRTGGRSTDNPTKILEGS